MNIAIIPARGGSKRIPRKNIREFDGKPMIAYAIEAAKKSGCFGKVIVSTDDREIAEIAVCLGAEVPFVRPPELSDDHTPTAPVIAHAISHMENAGFQLDLACCIYATVPFIRVEDLLAGLELMKKGDWHFAFSATSFGFPIFRSFEIKPGGSVGMFFPEHFKTRSQDLPEAWHDAGQFYWGKSDAWKNADRLFESHSTIIPLARWRVQDIDTPEDWDRAEKLFKVFWEREEDVRA
jgi:pseudaminic acid cytidylyltransferase